MRSLLVFLTCFFFFVPVTSAQQSPTSMRPPAGVQVHDDGSASFCGIQGQRPDGTFYDISYRWPPVNHVLWALAKGYDEQHIRVDSNKTEMLRIAWQLDGRAHADSVRWVCLHYENAGA